MSRRILILCRQSLTRGDTVSLAVQRATLTAHYEGRGDTVVGVLESENTRGWREDRADLSEAIARAKADEYDTLAVYSIDRLARKVRILETVADELAAVGVGLDSFSETWASDPFMRQIAGALAEKFTTDLSKRMRGVVAYKVGQGHHQGPAPFGFARGENDRLTPGNDAPAAAAMFTLRMHGLGRRAISDRLRADFGASLDASSILRSLRNPAYAGAVTGPGGAIVWEAHEGIVSRETWERVQALLASRSRAPRTAEPHWLEGISFCGCGSPLYRNEVRAGMLHLRCGNMLNGRGCANPKSGMRATLLEEAVIELFARDLDAVARASAAAVVARLVEAQEVRAPSWDKERARLVKQGERLIARRERLVEMRTDGDLSRDDFRAKLATIDAECSKIAAALAAGPEPIDASFVRQTIEAAKAAGARLRELALTDTAALRMAFLSWGGRVIVYDEPTVSYSPEITDLVSAARAEGV